MSSGIYRTGGSDRKCKNSQDLQLMTYKAFSKCSIMFSQNNGDISSSFDSALSSTDDSAFPCSASTKHVDPNDVTFNLTQINHQIDQCKKR